MLKATLLAFTLSAVTALSAMAAQPAADPLAPAGHWTGAADDFAQSGAQAHAAFAARSGLRRMVGHTEDEFLLEVFG